MGLIRRNIRVLLRPRRYRAELAAAERLLRSATEATNGAPDQIRRFLASDSWEVRNCAVKAIVNTRCEELYDALVDRLLDRDEAGILRRNCAELLPGIPLRTPKAVEALLRTLDDPYWEVRTEATRALARLADESAEAEARLLALLGREHNLEVQAAIAEALGALATGREAFDALARMAAEGPWLVRHQAAVALVELAARRPVFAESAAAVIRGLDLLAEGTATSSVFRQSILELAELMADGRPFPSPGLLRRRYLHLKHGWLRREGR